MIENNSIIILSAAAIRIIVLSLISNAVHSIYKFIINMMTIQKLIMSFTILLFKDKLIDLHHHMSYIQSQRFVVLLHVSDFSNNRDVLAS